MILAVDIGNTNIVISCMDAENIHFISRLSTSINKTEDEYIINIKQILDFYKFNVRNIHNAIISSVVPSLTHILTNAVKKTINCSPFIVNSKTKTGMNIKMDKNVVLGNDLIAASVGAISKYGFPIIIIDMGTATTITVIDKNKTFIGGLLIPGLQISQKALCETAAQLSYIDLEPPKNIIGKNTTTCMQSGLIYGSATMIDGIVKKIKKEIGYDLKIIATGGLAHKIIPYCESNIVYDDNLILNGLFEIYKQNKM